ncbi:MAG: sensor histidine kinase [Desulfuromonadales bacterium]
MLQKNIEAKEVGQLAESCIAIDPETRVNEVARMFLDDPQLEAVAVVEENLPAALVTRQKLFTVLLKPYAREVFARSSIMEIADTTPMIVQARESLIQVIDRSMQRPYTDIYDEIIVTDDDGDFAGILSVKRLVIEQGHVLARSMDEKELAWARAQEMQKVSEIRSQFIAHVTHELRSPVNVIIGLTELMGFALKKGQMVEAEKKLSTLTASATNLRAIITNILDLSKIEAGKMEIISENFDLMDILRDVVEGTRILIGGKAVNVLFESPVPSFSMYADLVKIRQILVNLMSNAAKFTDEGHIVLSFKPGTERIQLMVKDTGIGIRQDDLQRLFTAFSQLEDAKSRRREGTGLGLTITRELVDLLGGSIEVSSQYGRGTTFTTTLPLPNQS